MSIIFIEEATGEKAFNSVSATAKQVYIIVTIDAIKQSTRP